MKPRRCDAKDGKRMLVQPDRSANHSAVSLKMILPIPVTQHDVRSAVRPMLVRSMKESPQIRLNPHDVEEISAGFLDPRSRRIRPRIHSDQQDCPCSQPIEAVVAVPQIDVVGIRFIRGSLVGMLQLIQALRIRHMQRAQQNGVHHAEDHRVRANRQRQRQDSRNRKPRRLAQLAHTEPHILHQRFQEVTSGCLAALLLVANISAELDPRPPLRLSA